KPAESKPRRQPKKPSRLKIVALARRGLTAKQISEQFGIDYGVVWRQMKKAGLDASKPFIYRDNHGHYFKSVEDVKSFYKVSVSTVIGNRITGVTLERGQWSAGNID
uniref:helix-turn-helix domain-containing protein n=1 Tax=Lacticaseibacillus saniviri TaxID=931533 RepID=UPI000AA12246